MHNAECMMHNRRPSAAVKRIPVKKQVIWSPLCAQAPSRFGDQQVRSRDQTTPNDAGISATIEYNSCI